jgi:hypothetical protein
MRESAVKLGKRRRKQRRMGKCEVLAGSCGVYRLGGATDKTCVLVFQKPLSFLAKAGTLGYLKCGKCISTSHITQMLD